MTDNDEPDETDPSGQPDGVQVRLLLSLALLEWGVLRPVRMARTRQRAA